MFSIWKHSDFAYGRATHKHINIMSWKCVSKSKKEIITVILIDVKCIEKVFGKSQLNSKFFI